ncbi:sulfatase-like hydrolase/transferase [Clostridium botulinum D/C]|uniref:sulfatase-like hydrolase/transferase n=1 Tax=Clostridium botulinum TaxID=1491 RepID=UPI001E36F057|nr:sulfatase-like hydrolase/transferase [Clostridium botulinum]MCD3352050.1 sulfatase-like hydrolase/transferase [Clostridium botulinum D/C]MCD3360985.1 sulfatase-like hydrolase/transferase [Clostridium botulinum D/C]MCD3362809.1 sulfatase-like hydrolase/transferase [Clostridium botulinum D/C]MCD3366726.1 sulfatase-like hydrolase/transferase [Clostridium botulinum D/C]
MSKKTNIISIITDDQGYWSMGCYGNDDAITPTLDSLANNGIRFENFFCVSPVCSPARASIYTGRIPSQHGIHDWLDEWNNGHTTEEYLKGQSTFVEILAKNGYECAMSGKWHLGAADKPQNGFKYWYSHQKGGGPYYGAPMYKDGKLIHEERYVTDVMTDYGLDFIEKQRNSKNPFYLSLNYTAPHAPWSPENHPKELLDLYKNCEFNSCPKEGKNDWSIDYIFPKTEDERREVLRGYFAALTSVDNNIKRVIDKLRDMNILEDTLIIFTSDNGMNMGHHGIFGKGNGTSPVNMFDTSVKIPCFITKLGEIKPQVSTDLLSHYDLRPTLLEYLGIKDEVDQEIKLPGKSFVKLLKGEKLERDDNEIVIYDEYGPARMIRTKEWKYVHRYPAGPHELYDLVNDPDEKVNLIDNEEKQDIVKELRYKLKKWFIQYVNPEIDGAKLPVFGGGQAGFAGLWGKDEAVFQRYDSDFIFSCDGKLKND